MDNLRVDFKTETVSFSENGQETEISFNNEQAFTALSEAWLLLGWNAKYVYGFSWLGRPVIQLPEDLIRIQELIFTLKPSVLIETGVAHGGSLVFYASLFEAMGTGRVIGIDVEIRPHNREALDQHKLSPLIELVEGSSTDLNIFNEVKSMLRESDTVVVILDSNHSKQHVLREMELYSTLVTESSYLVVCDGILSRLKGAPRTSADCTWNNPMTAIDEFLSRNSDFENVEPVWPFNESELTQRVTYWPRGFLQKRARG